jgi:hypothetical protein
VARRNLMENREEGRDREERHGEGGDPRAPQSATPWRRYRFETSRGTHSHDGSMVPTAQKSALSRAEARCQEARRVVGAAAALP